MNCKQIQQGLTDVSLSTENDVVQYHCAECATCATFMRLDSRICTGLDESPDLPDSVWERTQFALKNLDLADAA